MSNRWPRQAELDFAGPFDPRGHLPFCPVVCDLWIEHYGRDNLDAVTLANLEWFRTRPNSCSRCRVEALPEPDRSIALALLGEEVAA